MGGYVVTSKRSVRSCEHATSQEILVRNVPAGQFQLARVAAVFSDGAVCHVTQAESEPAKPRKLGKRVHEHRLILEHEDERKLYQR